MYLIAGLGNPGERFKKTLHNTGFRVLEKLRKEKEWQKRASANYFFIKTRLGGEEALLLKPTTFMNRSGLALKEATEKFKVPPEKVILIHDDFALETGRIKVSRGRGPAGHKGVADVIKKLGTKNFVRVRVGVRTEKRGLSLKTLVLKKPKKPQKEKLGKGEELAEEAVLTLLREGVDKTMTRFNK